MDIYRERSYLLRSLAEIVGGYFVKDESGDPGFQNVFCMNLPEQGCWHIADSDMDLFGDGFNTYANDYDGHTTEEKYERLKKWWTP